MRQAIKSTRSGKKEGGRRYIVQAYKSNLIFRDRLRTVLRKKERFATIKHVVDEKREQKLKDIGECSSNECDKHGNSIIQKCDVRNQNYYQV